MKKETKDALFALSFGVCYIGFIALTAYFFIGVSA